MKYDVIVIGLGAMGSATTYHLAKAGANVLGIDQYTPPHIHGSTHGDTRITRLAIGEGAEYVPLVKRSHELWREIEEEVGYKLLVECGGLIMGVHNGQGQHNIEDFLDATIAAADRYGIEHETLNTEQIQKRFPQFALSGREDGYYEPEAGYVLPEQAVKAQLELARKYGATLNVNERVQTYEAKVDSVKVTTDKGSYEADKLVITAGPWVNDFVPEYKDYFKVYRQVLYWFDIADKADYEMFKQMPVYIWEFGDSADDFIYGFPAVDGANGGVKLAAEQFIEDTTPEMTEREVTQEETNAMYDRYVKDRLPGLSSKCIKSASCLYTTTPDAKFVLDYHPDHDNVMVASPCSGHGFKHSAAIGEGLSQIMVSGHSSIDLSSFSFSRFTK